MLISDLRLWTLRERCSWTDCHVCKRGCSWTMFRSPLGAKMLRIIISTLKWQTHNGWQRCCGLLSLQRWHENKREHAKLLRTFTSTLTWANTFYLCKLCWTLWGGRGWETSSPLARSPASKTDWDKPDTLRCTKKAFRSEQRPIYIYIYIYTHTYIHMIYMNMKMYRSCTT